MRRFRKRRISINRAGIFVRKMKPLKLGSIFDLRGTKVQVIRVVSSGTVEVRTVAGKERYYRVSGMLTERASNSIKKNPRAKIKVFTVELQSSDGKWVQMASYDSAKFHDPRGKAFSAAKVLARIENAKVRVRGSK